MCLYQGLVASIGMHLTTFNITQIEISFLRIRFPCYEINLLSGLNTARSFMSAQLIAGTLEQYNALLIRSCQK